MKLSVLIQKLQLIELVNPGLDVATWDGDIERVTYSLCDEKGVSALPNNATCVVLQIETD